MPITLNEGQQRELNVQMTPIPSELAVLYGTVTDNSTGMAVIGATVALNDTGYSALTDIAGFYQIIDIQPGVYAVTVSHPDYEIVVI